MNETVKKVIIIALVIIWFSLIMLPSLAVILASRGQIQLGAGNTKLRLFLLQEADVEGLGLEYSRPSSENTNCQQSTVNYFMWVGESENIAYCLCQEPQTGNVLPATSGTCLPP